MAHDQTPAPTTTRVLDSIRDSRARLEALIAGHDEAALVRPGPEGWSFKDHLAHLTAWRRMVLGYLAGKPQHEGLGLAAAAAAGGEEAINAALHERDRATPWPQVLAEFRAVYDELVEKLRPYAESDWQAPYPLTPPTRRPRLDNIEGNTFAHDDEHLGWVKAWL
jgi:hypothetical protein